jgi:hypothetical protein
VPLTVSDAIDEFLADAARRYPPEDVAELRWSLTGPVREDLGDLRLEDLGAEDMEVFVHELADSGVPSDRVQAIAGSVVSLREYFASGPGRTSAHRGDRLIAVALQLATLAFAVAALILFAESL